MRTQFDILGLEIVHSLKHNVFLVKETPVSDISVISCLKLNTTEQEIKLLQNCFPKIDQSKFKSLRLPVAIRVGSLFINDGWWVLMDYFQGESIDWNEVAPECAGGRNISLNYVDILINILADLKTIDINLFSDVLPSVESASWYTDINQKLTKLIEHGLFPSSYLQKATDTLSVGIAEESKKDFILTNGDFQFRNFIKLLDNKIAVIDWTENPINTPNIEPLEFAVMYQWTLMWANLSWQNAYVEKTSKMFGISKERLKFAALVKSINQAHLWLGSPELARLQVNHSIRALDGQI